ncbi:MAG: hypothetical protein AAGG47_21790 [Pseudomonadota bacterium]
MTEQAQSPAPIALPHLLPAALERELEDLYLRGTPANTLRAY